MAKGSLDPQGALVRRDIALALRAVAAAHSRRESAERDAAVCTERREALQRSLAASADAERARAAGGQARVADLVQAARYESAVESRLQDERTLEELALNALREARDAERAAEEALARARLDERAVEGRRARAALVERIAREDAHDEAAEEAAVARRGLS